MNNHNIPVQAGDIHLDNSPKTLICLCLDNSGSMQGEKNEELNRGLAIFRDELASQENTRALVEVAIVTFGKQVNLLRDFAPMQKKESIKIQAPSGGTLLGEAVVESLDMLSDRLNSYNTTGIGTYKPWLVIMSDGVSNGSPEMLDKAIKACKEEEQADNLTILPIAIGSDKQTIDALKPFSQKHEPEKIEHVQFNQFFQWLSQSASTIAQGREPQEMQGWGKLN